MTEYGQREPAGGAASVRCPHRRVLTGLASQHGASAIAAHCIRHRSTLHRHMQHSAPGTASSHPVQYSKEHFFGKSRWRTLPPRKVKERMKMERIFLYSGSFDPFTIGHADIVQRALALCDRLVIGIGYNEHKAGWTPVEERLRALKELFAGQPQVRVEKYSCTTVDFAQQQGITCIVRGVRGMTDMEYESNMATINRQLAGIDTILLPARPELAHVSSSMVRELAHFNKDISPYLPQGLHYII